MHLRTLFHVPFQSEAAVLVAAGGEFTVFIGGKPAAQGKGRPVLADLRPFLQKGENTVAVKASGAAAGLPPSFLLQIRARGEGRVADLVTDRSWKWSASVAAGWEQPGFAAQDWEPVTETGPLEGTPPEARGEIEALLAVVMDAGKFRAALVRSGPLLTALGRPNREQIVTRRQSVATTLEALELSNGPSMAGLVARSTRNLLAAGPATGRKFVESLYRKALARAPTAGELEAAMALVCGREKPDPEDPVRPEGAEDLLWCLLLHPEFQLIF